MKIRVRVNLNIFNTLIFEFLCRPGTHNTDFKKYQNNAVMQEKKALYL